MVGKTLQRRAHLDKVQQCLCQISTAGHEDGKVVQPGTAGRPGTGTRSFCEQEQVWATSSKMDSVAVTSMEFKAEYILIEGQRAFKIRDGQVNIADDCFRM